MPRTRQPSGAELGRSRGLSVLQVVLLAGCLIASALETLSAQGKNQPTLAVDAQEAQALLDAGDADEALAMLERLIRDDGKNAQTLLLRSTAHFLLGDAENGEKDLRRALDLDPGLRQGWLNLGGLELSKERYGPARDAFEKARDLDPSSSDAVLNLGVTELLDGQLPGASKYFATYTEMSPSRSEAEYLVAKNYAVAGYTALALSSLDRAVQLDEHNRLRARTDRAFEPLASDQRYQALLARDVYKPPAGSFSARRLVEEPYDIVDGRLLGAVVDTLKALGIPFSPRIEVTPGWSLVWSDMRIKVAPAREGQAMVEVIATSDRFTSDEWRERTERFYARLDYELAPKLPPGVSPRQ